ncbi:flavin-containing monooxygenase [Streptomyces nigra]|uniref:flavin-containing monooxygenase n=1 Tax=Streptomyces nigra TaxID=1827580 RepID=UPI0036D1DF35
MEHVDVAVIGGGQAGLAMAHALLREGVTPVVLEASDRAAGSWPRYYDSLTLFSPARYSALPGLIFPGDPDRYPHRDEVISYLADYAAHLCADIRTGHRVTVVHRTGDARFELELEDRDSLSARAVVAASGTFGRPYRPTLPGLDDFSGAVLHAAEYRTPRPFTGRRVVVVGAGNSAVQIAAELAGTSRVTLASRKPVKFARRRILGRDLHFWLRYTGLDAVPFGSVLREPPTQPVLDDGRYRSAVREGRPDRQPMFTSLDGAEAAWVDGTREEVDTIILATGYRPDVPYLADLDGALDAGGHPRHRGGAALTVPGLAFVGLEWQRALSSNSLRGVGRDAARVARHLSARLGRR